MENEWLFSRLLMAYGVPVASTEIGHFHGERCLIVQRFDRRLPTSGASWLHLPTEDGCQAAATPATNKYENNDGPGMLATFLKAQALFWMLRAIDGHAKTFGLFLNPGGRFQLTALCNLLSAWPIEGDDLVGRQSPLHQSGGDHQPPHADHREMPRPWRCPNHPPRADLEDSSHGDCHADSVPADFPERIAEPVLTSVQALHSQIQKPAKQQRNLWATGG